MNLSVPLQANTEVKKKLFKLKPLRRDGLLLNIRYSKTNARTNAKIRFFHCCFHQTGHVIAAADNDGHVYIVDFFSCKFWGLPKLETCTFIRFSSFNEREILTGGSCGDIYIIDFDSGQITGKLEGHKLPVNTVSFANKVYCLSASQYEAIIWDLQTNSKVQVLALDKNSVLKFVSFMPVSNNILACFKDDLIQIWNNDKFEFIKQFLPNNWNNFSVRTIVFSRNGQVMIIAGYLPTLAIFLLDKWKLIKLVSLPEYILTVKSVEFVTQPFDGGSNKILTILSGQGVVYFYDIEQNLILSELRPNRQIKKIECCPNGTYIACVMNDGEVELYNLNQYIMPPADVKVERPKKVGSKVKPLKECKNIGVIKSEINNILDIEKLKSILKEFNEYPEAHRLTIWEKLLQLPNNIEQYNSVINHTTVAAFKDLYSQYPLEMNWCQHWFEYYPLAPVNILAMIENLLMEHDPELLHHLASLNITSNLYAWPLLETAFSEVLTSKEWLLFWDHILTNEPSFFLCAVVSYNILHRDTLFSLKMLAEADFFFHNQNPNNTKKFIQKTYYILNHTSNKLHPRQYLEGFKSIEAGNYPLFIGYPKDTVDLQLEQMKFLNNELVNMEAYEADLLEQAKRKWEACECDKKVEEIKRHEEMKQVCLDRIKSEAEKVKSKHEELLHLKKMLGDQEEMVFSDARKKFPRINTVLSSPCNTCWTDLQDKYIKKYAKLLKYKYRIQQFVDNDDGVRSADEIEKLKKYQRKLEKEIDKVKKSLVSPEKLKQLNLATNIVAVESLIKDIERQLHIDSESSTNSNSNLKMEWLQKETRELEKSMSQVLDILRESRSRRSGKPSHEYRKEGESSSHKGDTSPSEACHKTVRFSS
ncbi:hypothetical protein NQ315_007047 [Exocentrus adspersus]|uniref:TBC1 domain family member 31 n=1 Tax=Exocentrus adspersus TaxID=1586481 RepID=A0AAV8WDF6_9CUCU|nr:hypothetical protein NQ315_007047 [Exocentrus adspersus]